MLKLKLTPVSTGRIFCSSRQNFEKKKRLPTTPLPSNHPFWQLWRDHLTSLRDPGNSDTIINALIAIARRNPKWNANTSANVIAASQQEMRDILARHPPDVVLLTEITDYGCHLRQEVLWPYICINEDYIDAWITAQPNRKEYLSLTALLRACLNHELGHWVQTLKVGYFSTKALRSHPPKTELIKNTSKSLNAPWTGEGEAGDYVEVCSQGGIIRYSAIRKKAYILTGPDKTHELTLSYLRQYESSTDFPSRAESTLKTLKSKSDGELFPEGADDCKLGQQPGCLRLRPGPGLPLAAV